jgi:DNA polymerase-3 subunit epsilon
MLKDTPCVIVDLETTGGRSTSHRVIEIAALKIVNGGLIDEFVTLIDPQRPIPPSITGLTGITGSMVSGAPTFRQVHEDVLNFFDGCLFIAHNARFDYGFLRMEFDRIGVKFSASVLCTVRLSRKLFPRYKRHNLSSIIDRFAIATDHRHRAKDDALAVWNFLKEAEARKTKEEINRAVSEIVRKPSLPQHLKTDIGDIPESPGVYFFYDGYEKMPLYIGKAKNLRSRVLSHFSEALSSVKEMNLSQRVVHIDTQRTEGELAALLLESYYIKTQLPLYNRRSRRSFQLVVLKRDTSMSHHRLSIESHDRMYKDDMDNVVMVFKNRRNATSFLEGIATEYKLCKTLLGLERKRSQQSCFYHQIKLCHGACIGEESCEQYNLRLTQALTNKQKIAWPYDGPVAIEECNHDHSRGEVFVVDQWIILDAFRYEGEARKALFNVDYTFDLDAYRILYGQLKRNRSLIIKPWREHTVV